LASASIPVVAYGGLSGAPGDFPGNEKNGRSVMAFEILDDRVD